MIRIFLHSPCRRGRGPKKKKEKEMEEESKRVKGGEGEWRGETSSCASRARFPSDFVRTRAPSPPIARTRLYFIERARSIKSDVMRICNARDATFCYSDQKKKYRRDVVTSPCIVLTFLYRASSLCASSLSPPPRATIKFCTVRNSAAVFGGTFRIAQNCWRV